MSTIDKNKAIIEYLLTCNNIKNSALYFNLIDAKDGNIQIITTSTDTTYDKSFIDGSKPKKYTCNIVTFKSINDLALVVGTSYANENVDDVADVQTLIDWIDEQNEARNFPDFGTNCIINSIKTTTDEPRFDGINTSLQPALAMYSIGIMVDYIDTSKVIWKDE